MVCLVCLDDKIGADYGGIAPPVIDMGIVWTVAWVAGLVGVLGGLTVFAWSVPRWQIFGPALIRGAAQGRHIALTFDDGPVSPFTEQILDILRARKVRATFFVCGKNVERFPEIVRRIRAEGHALGNHTFSHPFLYFRSPSDIAREIDRTQDAIERVTGFRPSCFRPPFGAGWFGLHRVLRERGLRLVQWSDTGYDWEGGAKTAAEIARQTLKGLGPGSIILLHDGRRVYAPQSVNQSNTVKALPEIIDRAREAGFTFVPLSDFLS